jgi:hypothetical protein
MRAKPPPLRTALAVRLDPATEARTRTAAARLGVTVTDVVRDALDQWLARHEAKEGTP